MSIVTPEAPLTLTREEELTPAEQLTSLCDDWHQMDMDNRERHVSFTELLMGDDWDLDQSAWAEGFLPEVAPPAPVPTMGSSVLASRGIDASAMVHSFLSRMATGS